MMRQIKNEAIILLMISFSLLNVSALPDDAQSNINFNYPSASVNYSSLNVNNSQCWQGICTSPYDTFVPYTGATSNVNIYPYDAYARSFSALEGLFVDNYAGPRWTGFGALTGYGDDFYVNGSWVGRINMSLDWNFLNKNLYTSGVVHANSSVFNWVDKLAQDFPPAIPPLYTLRLWVDYDAVSGFSTYRYKDDGNMTRRVSDNVFIGKNMNAFTIPQMSSVYSCGSSGPGAYPLICLARADNLSTMPAIGMTIEAIPSGSFGRVMAVGVIENINTNSFNSNAPLYVSDIIAGNYSMTKPITPNLTQEIGTVLVKSATAGKIELIARSLTGNEFGTINNFTVSAGHYFIGDGSQLTGISGGNPFDQSLNTTDNVNFSHINAVGLDTTADIRTNGYNIWLDSGGAPTGAIYGVQQLDWGLVGSSLASDGSITDGVASLSSGSITGGVDATFSGTGTFGSLNTGNVGLSGNVTFGNSPNKTKLYSEANGDFHIENNKTLSYTYLTGNNGSGTQNGIKFYYPTGGVAYVFSTGQTNFLSWQMSQGLGNNYEFQFGSQGNSKIGFYRPAGGGDAYYALSVPSIAGGQYNGRNLLVMDGMDSGSVMNIGNSSNPSLYIVSNTTKEWGKLTFQNNNFEISTNNGTIKLMNNTNIQANLNVTMNVTIGNLINLGIMTLPSCGSAYNGSIGRNSSGVYGCITGGVWNKLF